MEVNLCPKANERNRNDGWTFDYGFIADISQRTDEIGFYAGMEEVEAVLIALDEMGCIVSETATPGGEG